MEIILGREMFCLGRIDAPASPPALSCLQCQITFTIDKDMKGPVYVYYELRKFYQNHRSYVKSRSYDQLGGGVRTLHRVAFCALALRLHASSLS